MTLLVDARTTIAYKLALGSILEELRKDFYNLMKMDAEKRRARFFEFATAAVKDDMVAAWAQYPAINFMEKPEEYWKAQAQERQQIRAEVATMLGQDAMDAFAEDVQEIIQNILNPTTPVEIPAAPPPPVAQPEPAAEEYPAPDGNTMALDPVNAHGAPIPPLQTRNFYTLPKAERAKLMPQQSTDADDNSWMNNSVYNKGD